MCYVDKLWSYRSNWGHVVTYAVKPCWGIHCRRWHHFSLGSIYRALCMLCLCCTHSAASIMVKWRCFITQLPNPEGCCNREFSRKTHPKLKSCHISFAHNIVDHFPFFNLCKMLTWGLVVILFCAKFRNDCGTGMGVTDGRDVARDEYGMSFWGNAYIAMIQGRLCHHGPLARYVKLWVAHAPGMPGTFNPPLWLSDPGMHHGTCVVAIWQEARGLLVS